MENDILLVIVSDVFIIIILAFIVDKSIEGKNDYNLVIIKGNKTNLLLSLGVYLLLGIFFYYYMNRKELITISIY